MNALKNFIDYFKKIKRFTILFIIISFNPILTTFVFADCSNADPCPNVTWNPITDEFLDNIGYSSTETMDIYASWKWKQCPDGSIVIKDISAHADNQDFWTSFSIYQYNFSGFMEYAELQILNWLYNMGDLGNIPDCCPPENNCGIQIVKFYTASCGVWVRCSYEFACQPTIHHPRGPNGDIDCPQPWNNNGNTVVDVWQYQPCGDICCEKTYLICKTTSPTPPYDDVIKIANVDRHPYGGQMCSQQGQFFDWFTGQPYNCQDGCAGDGNS